MCKYIQTEGGRKPGATWLGSTDASPTGIRCNICQADDLPCFVDGATDQGYWAIMCPECFKTHGRGLGPGLGQKYCRQE